MVVSSFASLVQAVFNMIFASTMWIVLARHIFRTQCYRCDGVKSAARQRLFLTDVPSRYDNEVHL